ncbi:MAG: biopolymer transporter ExbD [Lentisphaerae bacterium]|nr:biopolymer transporter ExbD [Lentisphaerota bacterium]
MKLKIPQDDPEAIDMTPMIDIIFLLILFFMIASSFVDEARAYKVAIPEAEHTEVVPLDQARVIVVAADGAVAAREASRPEDAYRSLSELTSTLTAYREACEQSHTTAVVAIEADRDASYGRVMQVWNAVKNAGIRSVSFLVRSSHGGE